MHPHTQFAGDRHPSGPGPCRPVEPLLGPLPRCAEQAHCRRVGTSESGTPRAILLLVRPLLLCCLCHAPASALVQPKWCLLPPFARGPTEHLNGQVQRSQSSPLGQSVQGAAGKAKDDPPFSITRSSPHRACRPALVPVSMAWAAACMLQGNALALGASRSSPIPPSPHSLELRALIRYPVSTTVSLHTPWVNVVSKIRCLCSDHSFILVHRPAAMGNRGWYVRSLFADDR